MVEGETTLLLQSQDVMTTPLKTIKDTNSLIDGLPIMNSHHFRRLAIINNEPKLVGILTDKDIFKEILSNKQLLSDVYNNKNCEPYYSILDGFWRTNFETIYHP